MEDIRIIDLYWERSEDAISQTAQKYGKYCYAIAYNILRNDEDSEECVNDTWMRAWGVMPPKRPDSLATFLGKITRHLSLDKYRRYSADKRGSGQMSLALEELSHCIPATNHVEQVVDEIMLEELLDQFLTTLASEHRKIFMRRYWYVSSVKEIAQDYGLTERKYRAKPGAVY